MKNKRRSLMRKTVREDDDDCTETEECGERESPVEDLRQSGQNVSSIREINGNISRVISIYSDLSANFSYAIQQRRPVTESKPAKTMEEEVLTWQGTQTTETKATYLGSEPARLLPSSLIICPQA